MKHNYQGSTYNGELTRLVQFRPAVYAHFKSRNTKNRFKLTCSLHLYKSMLTNTMRLFKYFNFLNHSNSHIQIRLFQTCVYHRQDTNTQNVVKKHTIFANFGLRISFCYIFVSVPSLIQTVSGKNATLFPTIYNSRICQSIFLFYTIGNRNEHSTITCKLLT